MSPSDPAKSTRKAVGIDLGTTFCAVAHIDAYGKPQIIPNAESERITPSVILFDGMSAIVGTPEYQQMTIRSWATTTKLLARLDEPGPG